MARTPVKKATNGDQTTQIKVTPLKIGTIRLRIIGTTPMFQNRMSEKAKQQLLVGGGTTGQADRANIKHDPLTEYRSSAEIIHDKSTPTALAIRAQSVKASMSQAALETPGLTKSSANRLLFVPGELLSLYGVPQLRCDVVRSAGMNRTPDIRTRAYIPQWGAELDVKFVVPQLGATAVISLLCNAGILIGIGDFRQEKGKGSFGSFRVISADEKDPEWDYLVKNCGRKAQEAALNDPEYANAETRELLQFHDSETKRRAA